MNKPIKVLAIETSCDETAAAVIGETGDVDASVTGSRVKPGMTTPIVLSSVVSSSVELHAKTGGIVPEVASREQMKFIIPVVSQALLSSRAERSGVERSLFTSKDFSAPDDHRGVEMTDGGVGGYQEAIKLLDDITHIAVTAGPGLIGSLLVGFNAAKTLAYARDLPIVPINHIEGHLYSVFDRVISKSEFLISNRIPKTKNQKPKAIQQYDNITMFPAVALTVSGGHTMLVLMKGHGDYAIIGQTIDDAVGEAYDKVARLLGLGYPGGPAISKMASIFSGRGQESGVRSSSGKSQTPNPELRTPIVFPRPIMKDGTFNFSFSGLKTAVLVLVKKIMVQDRIDRPENIPVGAKEEIAAAFEEAIADVLSYKLGKAVEKYQPKTVIFAGGVSANSYLRESIKGKVLSIKGDIEFLTPDAGMSGDNAAMIGLAAYYHIQRGDVSNWKSVKVDANLKLV